MTEKEPFDTEAECAKRDHPPCGEVGSGDFGTVEPCLCGAFVYFNGVRKEQG